MRSWALGASLLMLAACNIRGNLGLQDNSAVQTPVYAANKVLFATPMPGDGRFARLMEGYEAARLAQSTGADGATRRSVRNRDPLSIVVSRAYVPASINQCSKRASDIFRGQARDIAVLLDIATQANQEEFIAVWYQRDVPPDEALSFQNLLVYSSDSWDAKFPPYFRLRLVDVSAERNTETGALLDRIRASSSTISNLLNIPSASELVGIGALAARQVLAHERDHSLVDFTFELYDASLLGEAGGVPLGVLQTGGIVVTSAPCGQGDGFWEGQYNYDNRLDRIESAKTGEVQAVPYVFATVLTADLSVPQIVRERSAAIMKRLTDPKVTQADLQAAQEDADRLAQSLDALSVRESFRRRPSKESFATMVSDIGTNWSKLDSADQGFLLDALYQVTGANLSALSDYQTWIANCGDVADFDPETARFKRDTSKVGKDGKPCWT